MTHTIGLDLVEVKPIDIIEFKADYWVIIDNTKQLLIDRKNKLDKYLKEL